jgi:hypothetical protein
MKDDSRFVQSLRFTSFLSVAIGASMCAQAQSFSYPDFSSTAGLQLNGSAAQVGNVLELTPASLSQSGSAFSTTQIALQNQASFSTAFTFKMPNVGGIGDGDGTGADGIVFALQTVASNVGGAGGGIGYAGINHSLGVEFDTYNNGGADNDGNHVALDFNGALNDTSLTHVSDRMNNGAVWHAWVDYNGLTSDLQVRLSETSTRPSAPTIDYVVPGGLESILGQSSAYVGFTAGTGAGFENQDILSWQFNNNFQPIETVADTASSLLLLGIAVSGLVAFERRFRKIND